jgi:hypothetical protein
VKEERGKQEMNYEMKTKDVKEGKRDERINKRRKELWKKEEKMM